jgi:hypothetical protein
VATVKGTNAGPFCAVPITPAGIPTGSIAVGPVKFITLAETPALLKFIVVIYSSPVRSPIGKIYVISILIFYFIFY